jgi:hypothetical protein
MKKPDPNPTPAPQPAVRCSEPARCRILVGKHLSPAWSDRLAGMRIGPAEGSSSAASMTQLEGVLQDQAVLSGVLNTLYDFGFPLLSVEVLEGDPRPPAPDVEAE